MTLTDRSLCGRINQPFPDMIMSITSIWMLYRFTPENGATWIVPGTHRELANPRGEADGIDEHSTIPNEQQICGDAGDVLLIDSRIWHSRGANTTDETRTSVVARYSPWWLSTEYGKRNAAFVPADIFDSFPQPLQELYAHRRGQATARATFFCLTAHASRALLAAGCTVRQRRAPASGQAGGRSGVSAS